MSIDIIRKMKMFSNYQSPIYPLPVRECFDEDMMKLESLTARNSNARLDLVAIQKRMIELGLNYNLNPILEIDESNTEKNMIKKHSIDRFINKIGSKQQTDLKLNSLKDLLVL